MVDELLDRLRSVVAVTELVRACTRCGKPIVVQQLIPGGIRSEYVGKDGECFECFKA